MSGVIRGQETISLTHHKRCCPTRPRTPYGTEISYGMPDELDTSATQLCAALFPTRDNTQTHFRENLLDDVSLERQQAMIFTEIIHERAFSLCIRGIFLSVRAEMEISDMCASFV